MKRIALIIVTLALAAPCLAEPLSPHPVLALEEQRYCGAPTRDAAGVIVRRADVRAAFKRAHPCPSTGLSTGACPDWYMDHPISLACGGCDAVSNLQWLPTAMWKAKSLWERKIYCDPPQRVP